MSYDPVCGEWGQVTRGYDLFVGVSIEFAKNAAYAATGAILGQALGRLGEVASEIRAIKPLVKISPKIARQMQKRGWTETQIQEAIEAGQRLPAKNLANGHEAIRYVHPTTGQSVVVDKVTGQVIHVGGPGFRY